MLSKKHDSLEYTPTQNGSGTSDNFCSELAQDILRTINVELLSMKMKLMMLCRRLVAVSASNSELCRIQYQPKIKHSRLFHYNILKSQKKQIFYDKLQNCKTMNTC